MDPNVCRAIAASLVLIVTSGGTEESRRFRGRVVDDRGQPVKRFVVEVGRAGQHLERREFRDRGRRRLAARASGRDGAFELELPPGEAVVTVLGPGDTQSASSVIGADLGEAPWQFVLPRPASIRGRVCDSLGQPVADCPVLLDYPGQHLASLHDRNPDAGEPPDRETDPRFCARSGDDGRFELSALCPPGVLLAAVGPEGAESDWMRVELDPDRPAEVTVTLLTGARIVGTIDASLGDPAGRQVDLFSFRGQHGWRTTRSAADGSFRIDTVIPQNYVIELRPPGYPEQRIVNAEDGKARVVRDGDPSIPSIRRNLTVRAGAAVHVRFARSIDVIRVGGRLTVGGQVRAGIGFRLHPRSGQDDLRVRGETDADGRFTFELSAPGDWLLDCDDGATCRFDFTVPAEQANLPEPLDLAFDLPGGEISGTLCDPHGRPLANQWLTLLRDPPEGAVADDDFWSRFERERTDRDGRFRFAFRPPGRYTLRAPDGLGFSVPPLRSEWGRVVMPDLVVEEAPLPPLSIAVQPEAQLAGRVVDRAGRPVAEARIDVIDVNGRVQSAFSEVVSDATGSFHHFSLAAGVVEAVANRAGRKGRRAGVVLEAGKVVQVEIVID